MFIQVENCEIKERSVNAANAELTTKQFNTKETAIIGMTQMDISDDMVMSNRKKKREALNIIIFFLFS